MNSHLRPIALVIILFVPGARLASAKAGVPSFRNEVMAVLSKTGCNTGVCHGNKNGKGGFKLSLRGEDDRFDFDALRRRQSGRRTNVIDPADSLILLKPTMQLPHEGGRRFKVGSPAYDILRQWIAGGMPRDPPSAARLLRIYVSPAQRVLIEPAAGIQLTVQAEFSDGTTRDMTQLAVYETVNQRASVTHDGMVQRQQFGETTVTVRLLDQQVPVRLAFIPARPNFTWAAPQPSNYIDEHVFRKLRRLQVKPSAVCNDTVFLRRSYLDLLGQLPTADEARQFVSDRKTDKRMRLVDELLRRQEFADFWAQKWSDLLRNEEKTLDRKGVQNFYAWIRLSISSGKPLDQFVRELISSRGNTYSSPAANYYRAMRDPLMRAESTAQLFLGIRLQCAKCHNHPFDRWTQNDYYGWANLFARVQYKVLENRRLDRNDKHEFDGEQVVYMMREGDVNHPGLGKPLTPRFLDEATTSVSKQRDRLRQLADWLGSPDNDRFVKTQVNRIWYNLMGRGIVDPIDDFRTTNPPSNPELLQALAADFVANKLDLRYMIRRIMYSQTYQLSAVPNETNRDDEHNFSRTSVRRLSAEQLTDALSQVAGVPVRFNGYPSGLRAGEIPGVRAIRLRDQGPSQGDQFLRLFGKPPRLQTCECERSDEATLSQAFQLISGPMLNDLLTHPNNRLAELLKTGESDADIVDELYWTALSRPPGDVERQATTTILSTAEDKRRALEDITWSLTNCNEFVLRR